MKRLLINVIILGCLFWIHPLVGIGLALVYAFSLDSLYYELVIFGFLIDVVYGTFIEVGFLTLPLYTLTTFIIFLALGKIQKSIDLYV